VFLTKVQFRRDGTKPYEFDLELQDEQSGRDDRNFTYWLKEKVIYDVPDKFFWRFCSDSKHKGACKSNSLNFWVCADCMLPRTCIWPLLIVECDECEELFFIKRYPIRYHLCSDCGGE
jgi:hypothetical protein